MSGPTAHPFQLRGVKGRFWRQSCRLSSLRVLHTIYRLLLPDVCSKYLVRRRHVGLTVVTFSVGKLLAVHRYAKPGCTLVDFAFA
jgi:hypothetical protein